MAEKTSDVSTREEQRLARREPLRATGPFAMLESFADEMDRVFDDFGLSRSWFAPRFGRGPLSSWHRARSVAWIPQIETSQHDNEFIVRADLPGMKKEDISVDVTDDAIAFSGERRQEQDTERGGVYRSERSYGSFHRTIPLPEGAISGQAKATFKDGVLEITVPAPPEQVTRGRRLEIKEGTEAKK